MPSIWFQWWEGQTEYSDEIDDSVFFPFSANDAIWGADGPSRDDDAEALYLTYK